MKILDKLKNALFEEEYVEVNEKQKKEKPIAKKIVLPEEKKEKKERKREEVVFEEDIEKPKKEKEFKFPAISEEDFIDLTEPKTKVEPLKQEVLEKEPPKKEKPKEQSPYSYTNSKKEKEVSNYRAAENTIKIDDYGTYEKKMEKKNFRPSPVISPIYGVIDDNFPKEEIPPRKEVRITSSYASRNLDVDSVRAKAYGSNDDIFEEELTSSDKTKKEELKMMQEKEQDVLLDITETAPTVSKVTVGDAEEYFEDLGLEYNIDYKDISHERKTGRRVDLNREEEPITNPNEERLEDNLFDLINARYEEKEGE